jgi:uncharacterized protein YbaA (DUF1428 family)
MAYVDGFVTPVPSANKDAYVKLAAELAPVFKEYGALKVVETWGDDVPKGKDTDFYMAVKCKEDETVVLSWVFWPDKATRTAGVAKLMAHPLMQPGAGAALFDGKRMILGGFEVILDL